MFIHPKAEISYCNPQASPAFWIKSHNYSLRPASTIEVIGLLKERVLSASVLLPIVIATSILGGWWFFALVMVFTLFAGYEYIQMLRRINYRPYHIWTLALIVVLSMDAYIPGCKFVMPAVAGLLLLSLSWQLFQENSKTPTVDWALAIAGGVYIGWAASTMLKMRSLPNGLAWLAVATFSTWASDSAAYFIGGRYGRHYLYPRLSPKKSWEGAVAGLLAGVLTGGLIGIWSWRWLGAIGLWHGLLAGLLVAIASPFGDLAISMMKREAGVKDSSNFIPGHGGFLDRIDSMMFVVIVIYYYAVWVANGA